MRQAMALHKRDLAEQLHQVLRLSTIWRLHNLGGQVHSPAMARNGFWDWFFRLGTFAGVCVTAVGLIDFPEQIERWAKLFDRTLYDPRAIALAEYAVEAAQFLNLWYVRVALVSLGILMLIWPLRWFWRFRASFSFRWRRLLADHVWISREDAERIVRDSSWGRLKEPNVVKSVSVFDSLAHSFTRERVIYGMSDTDKELLKYRHFIDLTIRSFCEANPDCRRIVDGNEEIEEGALRVFLGKAMDDEIRDEFGTVPRIKVG